jgi:hypothetical protein
LLVSWLWSCRSTKKIQTAISKIDSAVVVNGPTPEELHADSMRVISETYKRLMNNRIAFESFSAKIKVDMEDKEGKKSDFNAFLRLRRDSALWVSVNVALGIEAFRVLITPDSVKVLNKLDKLVQVRSVESLQEITHLPFSFTELQNVIIGNPIFIDSTIISYKNNEQTISLFAIGEVFKHMLTVSKEDFTMLNSKLDDVDANRARTCLVEYGNYQRVNDYLFSTLRTINVTEKTKLVLQLDYKQFAFNEVLTYPFSVPKNYKFK